MFEVNLGEKTNIKKDIENLKNKKSNFAEKIVKWTTITIASTAISNILFNTLATNGLALTNVLIMNLAVVGNCLVLNEIFGLGKKLVNSIKKKKSKNNLENLSEILNVNNIHTNEKELFNAAIFENSLKTTTEVNNDGKIEKNEETKKDTYYVFLDENSNLCGILEQNKISKENNETFEEKKYFVLEDEDIKEFRPKLSEVKKLVRKP